MIVINNRNYYKTIIIFSGLAPRNDIFEWSRSFEDFRVNIIGVRDDYNSWYMIEFEQVLSKLREELRELNSQYVGCVGGSAGGFASLLFGKELGVDKILCFSPQSACGKIKRDLGDLRWPEFCNKTPGFDISNDYSNAIVYCAEDDELDMMHVGRLSGVDLRKRKSGGHILPIIFKDDGKLEEILREML